MESKFTVTELKLQRLTGKASNHTARVTVTLLTGRVVVELLSAPVALHRVEVGLAVAEAGVVARRADRTGRIAIASWKRTTQHK